jgi:quinohemoprotein ethanol dehydrogenase
MLISWFINSVLLVQRYDECRSGHGPCNQECETSMDELLLWVPGSRTICPFVIGIILPLWLFAVSNALAVTNQADSARLSDDSPGVDWAGPGGTYGEQHFSPLTQINAQDVSRLGLARFIDLPPGNTVSAPLEIAGLLYFVTGWGIVHAVDVKTGRQLWQYDAKTPEHAGPKIRAAWGSRGIAWWNGKIYLGTADGRLIAIDSRTGSPVWTVMTTSPEDQSYITGAPRAFDGKVIIGFGGADEGPARGYVSTYDAESGKLLWRWYTVPGNPANGFENKAMEMAAKTWAGEWWKYGGGGTVWNAMSYDPETHTVIIGVGNGSPRNHKARSAGKGDNLFLCSLVALDADSGTYKWHYQVNPGESWDYTATNDMEFASLAIAGQTRKVLIDPLRSADGHLFGGMVGLPARSGIRHGLCAPIGGDLRDAPPGAAQ